MLPGLATESNGAHRRKRRHVRDPQAIEWCRNMFAHPWSDAFVPRGSGRNCETSHMVRKNYKRRGEATGRVLSRELQDFGT